MDWYARFLKDIKSEKYEVNFKKDNGSQKTRYYIAGEDEEKYFIVKAPNNINSNVCCSFNKKDEGIVFKLSQEQGF